jgi:hypothetical protein
MSKQPNKLLIKRVESSINAVVRRNQHLTYPELFIEMGILSKKDYAAWKAGQIPFLEKVIHSNLTRLARIMTAVRRFARENQLERNSGPQPAKQYSKTATGFLEEEYRAIYRIPVPRPNGAALPKKPSASHDHDATALETPGINLSIPQIDRDNGLHDKQ